MTTSNDYSTAQPVEALQVDDIVATAKHWGVLLTFGILTGGLGVAMIVWPEKTVAVAAVLLGISLLISGVFGLVASFTQPDRSAGARVLTAISGAISIALGLIAFRGITQAIAILVIVVGIGWVMRGIIEVVAGIQAPKGMPGRGLTITSGVIGLAAGAAILLWPSITLTALVWIVGLTLILIGLVEIFGAFQLRSAGKRVIGEVTVGEVVTD